MPLAIKINPKDNVVVALHPIAKGTAVPVGRRIKKVMLLVKMERWNAALIL